MTTDSIASRRRCTRHEGTAAFRLLPLVSESIASRRWFVRYEGTAASRLKRIGISLLAAGSSEPLPVRSRW